MGMRWYLHNETLNQYYYTGSSSLRDLQRFLNEVIQIYGWTLEHKIHAISDLDTEIVQSLVIN